MPGEDLLPVGLLNQTLRIWLRIQISLPTPELGPFKPSFKPKSFIDQKSENLQWEKCRYITGREKTFSDTAQYFHLKHLKKLT